MWVAGAGVASLRRPKVGSVRAAGCGLRAAGCGLRAADRVSLLS